MLNHYVGIIIDKIVDVVVTVIVIDRALAWRERRRWKRVRVFVELQLEAVLGDILKMWSVWLASLRKNGGPVKISEEALKVLKENSISIATSLPPADFELFIELCAGEPIPTTGEKSFIDATNPRNFHRELQGYLVYQDLNKKNPAWSELVRNLQTLVPKLAELVERLPKDKLANDEISYREFTEELNLLSRRLDPSLYNDSEWDDEFNRLDRMTNIARSILGIMLLVRLLRTSH